MDNEPQDTLTIPMAVSDAYRAEKLAKQRGLSLEALVALLLSAEVIITSPAKHPLEAPARPVAVAG